MMLSTKRITMFTVSLVLFMDVLDSNIINTAVPAMSTSFNVSPIDLKIALISYFVSLAIFIPISGWTADKYGTKRVFITAIGLFTLSSFWCGYAHSLMELVIARFIQGIGGAFMMSLGRLIIARAFKRHELVDAMNTVIIVVSVAVMLGPFIGGLITDNFSWPWIFWVNIPAGAFTMLLAAYGLKDTVPKKAPPFDALGFILFGGSLALLCFSLSSLSESKIELNIVLYMILTAIILLLSYIIHARRHRHPIVKISLFRIRTFQVSVFGNLLSRLGFGGVPFLLPLLLQVGLHFSAQLSGLLLAPMAFGIIFAKLIALKILRQVGYKRFLLFNTILVSLVLWTLQIINAETSAYTIATLTFIFGIFVAAQYTGMNSLAFAELHEDELSASTSITSTVQVLAQSFGVAVGAILLRYYSSQPNEEAALTPAIFHQAFFALGIITFISALLFMRLKRDDGKQMLVTDKAH